MRSVVKTDLLRIHLIAEFVIVPDRAWTECPLYPSRARRTIKKGSVSAPFFTPCDTTGQKLLHLFKIGINNIVVVLLAGSGACAGGAAATWGPARITARMFLGRLGVHDLGQLV